ncbi:hypothetical protein [Oceanobacillus locisalsi]|uniref:Uncharacterized protein n=1 Tax=Oceanobacillus locisalsi TaxID=546107 RepID=A0ABW3NG83_9BACI
MPELESTNRNTVMYEDGTLEMKEANFKYAVSECPFTIGTDEAEVQMIKKGMTLLDFNK